ncbi:hypothetical protein C7S20_02950 [Christiangramia fulva]|uniref:Secreted protein n=1 Tax=Christiangramia fulva TaxID=2126553 RepID=A0A2R3Z204_9FLAO|nr:hypothetical protein [Christiangramia fulva]AVR44297.1 hypothetical protein C7S20_02950 [Christiangramia fulva]
MKKAFLNRVSVLMAFLVLLSTFSFTVQKHYCGDFLVDAAVFSKAKSCGMDSMQAGKFSDHPDMKKDGCSDKQFAVKGQKDLKHGFSTPDMPQQAFIASFVFTYFNLFLPEKKQIVPFDDYSPPLIVSDIQLEDQVFLI